MRYLLISHGALATGMLSSIEMIMGTHENLDAVETDFNTTKQDILDEFQRIYDSHDQEELMIVCDIFGGTPSGDALEFIADKDNVYMLAGMSLPIMMELLLHPVSDFDDLMIHARHGNDEGFRFVGPKGL